jgi:hypothetical protein
MLAWLHFVTGSKRCEDRCSALLFCQSPEEEVKEAFCCDAWRYRVCLFQRSSLKRIGLLSNFWMEQDQLMQESKMRKGFQHQIGREIFFEHSFSTHIEIAS